MDIGRWTGERERGRIARRRSNDDDKDRRITACKRRTTRERAREESVVDCSIWKTLAGPDLSDLYGHRCDFMTAATVFRHRTVPNLSSPAKIIVEDSPTTSVTRAMALTEPCLN